ncbi:putative iron uptake regulatory protein [Nostocoides japonicum T1-X7]|uniref:Putative iron uptake regulatory protein n=1 Tax=Nostocoides japonicum T1-X7 TaxID=1194083 RepID=A0A077M243_9MICO|nr:Fur family transcriptional regulator [Tetrasphaera japonica]CCH78235.1 putative iron uptake regulatory protein [Tetrasphaera japonica T1-X7]
MDELGSLLRSRGMRLTRQRERVMSVLAQCEHATPEQIHERVTADGGPEVSLSTVYRCLEALEDLGVVRHTHLDHRAPSYQLAGHADHVHLVCNDCGSVSEFPLDLAGSLVHAVDEQTGFAVDLTHVALHGSCARCRH